MAKNRKNNFKITHREPTSTFKVGKAKEDDKLPIFSFKNFIKGTKFYTKEHSNADKNCFLHFLNASKDFCNITWGEIKQAPKQFHFHELENNNKNIFELKNFDDTIPFIQFKLPNHDKARFIGYFDENAVFNVVLYDRVHNVYKRK